MKIRLCYRLEKELEVAEDENGNPTECYICCKVEVEKEPVPRKEYQALVNEFKQVVAKEYNADEKYVTPITLNDYLNNTEED